jgi:hypothetical protein
MAVDEHPSPDQLKSRADRPRLLLRIAVGVLLVAGMFYGWAAMGRQKASKQSEAVRAVLDAGGVVYWDYQWKDGQADLTGRPRQPAWLRRLVGEEFFHRAVAVDLRKVTDLSQAVESLPLLPYLTALDASGTDLDDDDVKFLRRLAGLRRLELAGTAITDDGLVQLDQLANLNHLSLASTRVTDEAIDVLARLDHLEWLDVSETDTSQEAIGRLRTALPKCSIQRAD